MSLKQACSFVLAFSVLLSPTLLLGGEDARLIEETRAAMLIAKQQAMAGAEEAGTTGATVTNYLNETRMQYTFESNTLWVRYRDDQPARPESLKDFTSVGEGDELILMDYSKSAAYIHQSGLHENDFYHIRLVAQSTADVDGEKEDGALAIRFLKAKVPEVGSIYPENWDEDEEMMVRAAFEKRIRSFCAEFSTNIAAGPND